MLPPIHRAGLVRHLAVLLLALACVPVQAQLSRDEELVHAAAAGERDKVDALLKAGANANHGPPANYSPLLAAATNRRWEVIPALLAAKANPDARGAAGQTALFMAVEGGRRDTVQALLAAGADPSISTTSELDGRSALLLAVMNRRTDIAMLLLDAGANANAANTFGDTPLRWAVSGQAERSLELVRALLARQVDVEAGQFPAYQLPAPCTAQEQVDFACIRGPRRAEGTPLGIAVSQGSVEIVRALLSAKANVNARQTGWLTPLMIAAQKGRADVVQALLAAGADASARDSRDETAMTLAAAHPQVVALLQAAATSTPAGSK